MTYLIYFFLVWSISHFNLEKHWLPYYSFSFHSSCHWQPWIRGLNIAAFSWWLVILNFSIFLWSHSYPGSWRNPNWICCATTATLWVLLIFEQFLFVEVSWSIHRGSVNLETVLTQHECGFLIPFTDIFPLTGPMSHLASLFIPGFMGWVFPIPISRVETPALPLSFNFSSQTIHVPGGLLSQY